MSVVIWAGLATLNPIQYCEFGSNDYWNAISFGTLYQCGNFSGCGINNGNSSSCARKEITRRINSRFCFETCEASYFSNISITSFFSGTYVNPVLLPCTGLDWTWSGALFGNLTNECLSPYQLDCYTRGIKNVGNAIATGQGKCLVSVQIQEMLPLCSCPYMWDHYFYLGIPVIFNPN
ncbi:MAG: hypothetical protein JNL47_04215 [Bacteroidia bacterium]|nr:hypothetical protein [Bacteroidia bacterium]